MKIKIAKPKNQYEKFFTCFTHSNPNTLFPQVYSIDVNNRKYRICEKCLNRIKRRIVN